MIILTLIITIIFYYYLIKIIIKIIEKINRKTLNKSQEIKQKIQQKENINNPNINENMINYYKNNSIKINNIQVEKKNVENKKYTKYYQPKRYITTLNELNYYKTLIEIAKELNLVLFAQVSLYSIIEMKKNLDYSTKIKYFNKINKKSIDFVLVDEQNCKIKLCIELDDTTHNKYKRKERDEFINELFKELEIPLIRQPVNTIYHKETIKQKILENLKTTYYK